MILLGLAFLGGVVVGGLLVIVFGKNNQNRVNQLRADVLAAYGKGSDEVGKLVNSWKK